MYMNCLLRDFCRLHRFNSSQKRFTYKDKQRTDIQNNETSYYFKPFIYSFRCKLIKNQYYFFVSNDPILISINFMNVILTYLPIEMWKISDIIFVNRKILIQNNNQGICPLDDEIKVMTVAPN